MILIDSSAWIEFLNGTDSRASVVVDQALANDLVLVGDLVVCEVLQGFRDKSQRDIVDRLFAGLRQVDLGGQTIARLAADHYTKLRAQGITVRKTIDCIIATYCIAHDIDLIHADRDFEAFEHHLGLRVVN